MTAAPGGHLGRRGRAGRDDTVDAVVDPTGGSMVDARRAAFERLADERDHAARWRLVLAASLDVAVPAMPLFDGWRPADEAGRALFARLRAADPGAIVAAARPAPVMRPAPRVGHLSFSPDVSEVATMSWDVLEIHSLPAGRLLHRSAHPRSAFTAGYDELLHLGDALVRPASPSGSNRGKMIVRHRRPRWDAESLASFSNRNPLWLARVPGGFVADTEWGLFHGTADGPLPVRATQASTQALLAADPVTGRLAATEPKAQNLIVLDSELRVTARHHLGHALLAGWFLGPARLVTYGDGGVLRSWEVTDDSIVAQGATVSARGGTHPQQLGLTVVPTRGLVVLERPGGPPTWLRAHDLAAAEAPAVYGDRFPVWVSPGEEYAVLRGPDREGEMWDVRQLAVAGLLTRPMGDARPADLVLAQTLDRGGTAVALLDACLAYRFRP
jgi:hypothetical protein